MKKNISTPSAPAPIGPYSQAIKTGNLMFVSGQIALHPETGTMTQESVEAETQQVMENIGAILKAAGMDYTNIVKTTIYLRNMDDFANVNKVYGSFFTSDFPARETVQVSRLPKDANVEITVVASTD
jgi:2-iminobutanoate/2-iminopropanoate deaminase